MKPRRNLALIKMVSGTQDKDSFKSQDNWINKGRLPPAALLFFSQEEGRAGWGATCRLSADGFGVIGVETQGRCLALAFCTLSKGDSKELSRLAKDLERIIKGEVVL